MTILLYAGFRSVRGHLQSVELCVREEGPIKNTETQVESHCSMRVVHRPRHPESFCSTSVANAHTVLLRL